ALEGAGLATVDAVEGGTELDLGFRPDVVAGGAQSLEHLLAGGGVLRQCRAGRSCHDDPSDHPCPHRFPPLLNSDRRPAWRRSSIDRKPAPHKRASRLEPTCDRNLHAVRMALSAGGVNGPKGEFVPRP